MRAALLDTLELDMSMVPGHQPHLPPLKRVELTATLVGRFDQIPAVAANHHALRALPDARKVILDHEQH